MFLPASHNQILGKTSWDLDVNAARIRRPFTGPVDLRPIVVIGFHLPGDVTAVSILASLQRSWEAANFTQEPFVKVHSVNMLITGSHEEDSTYNRRRQQAILTTLQGYVCSYYTIATHTNQVL
jgi:hypothetical protein